MPTGIPYPTERKTPNLINYRKKKSSLVVIQNDSTLRSGEVAKHLCTEVQMDFSGILLPKREVYEFGSDCSDGSMEDGLKREKKPE